jgi:hypothetical protein
MDGSEPKFRPNAMTGVSRLPQCTRPLFRKSGARDKNHSTSSGHGTIVDFTVFIAIASATACPIPSSVNG